MNKLEYWEAGYDTGIILKARTQFWEEQSNKWNLINKKN